MPLAHFTQEVGGHDDEEKDPAGHKVQVELCNAPTVVEDVPEGHGEQALVPLTYVPAAHTVEQEEDPSDE